MNKMLFLRLLLVPVLGLNIGVLQAKLTIDQGKAVIDLSDLKSKKPLTDDEAIAYGVKCGALSGGILGGAIAFFLLPESSTWQGRLAFTGVVATLAAAGLGTNEKYDNPKRTEEYEKTEGLTLCGAVAAQKIEIVQHLLSNGHCPHKIDEYGHNAFHYAAATGNSEILTLLVTATLSAVSQNKLLKPINKRDALDRTPAMIAAQCDNPAALRVLISGGADVGEIQDQFGQTVNDMVKNKPALKKTVADLKV